VPLAHRAQLALHADPRINGLRIRASGELDITSAEKLIRTVEDQLPPEHHLIIDLAHVTTCDVGGISALIDIRDHQAFAGHTIGLINISAAVHRAFELAELVDLIECQQFQSPVSHPQSGRPDRGSRAESAPHRTWFEAKREVDGLAA
jgi:anti-anti-sigma factor